MNIDGSVAIVTGGSGGIGTALAQRFVERGGRVVVTDLGGERVDATVAYLDSIGPGRVAGLAGDSSQVAHVQAVIDLAAERFGPVDLYAANAGVAPSQGLESSDDEWDVAVNVNVLGHVRAARLLVPGWLERGRGYFLSTASAAGLLTQIGSPIYAVTKHAAVAFAEWMSVTYGSRGITVSCLCPMGVNTAMLFGEQDSNDARVALSAKAVIDSGGVLEPLAVADVVMDAIGSGKFLILPHPEVLEFFRRKSADYDRWLAGMRRYQASLEVPLDHEGDRDARPGE